MPGQRKMVEFQQLRSELDVLRERLKQTNNPAERQALIRNAGKLLADLEAAVQQSQKELAEFKRAPSRGRSKGFRSTNKGTWLEADRKRVGGWGRNAGVSLLSSRQISVRIPPRSCLPAPRLRTVHFRYEMSI